jgi:hypothetical protein
MQIQIKHNVDKQQNISFWRDSSEPRDTWKEIIQNEAWQDKKMENREKEESEEM